MLAVRKLLLLFLTSLALMPMTPVQAKPPSALRVTTLTQSISGTVERVLPFAVRNVAVYWEGHPDAKVTVAFSRDGERFGRPVDVGRDEIGEHRGNGITYGRMLTTFNAKKIKIRALEKIKKLTVVGIRDRVQKLVDDQTQPGNPTQPEPPRAPRPAITARADWAADESLRFRPDGSEKWTPTFAPITKLVVHHTDTPNGDKNPSATVRAIYHYHAVTQDWGDIGYNFLIDESGRIYKGRNSHGADGADTIHGKDAQNNGVTGAHALGHNRGTVGVALLGNLTSRDATAAARDALARLLAWEADAHGIDPHGASVYTSSTGEQSSYPNIGGHRDTGRQTACPGETFHRTLPQLRDRVASYMLS